MNRVLTDTSRLLRRDDDIQLEHGASTALSGQRPDSTNGPPILFNAVLLNSRESMRILATVFDI